jgi:hypothetical protein
MSGVKVKKAAEEIVMKQTIILLHPSLNAIRSELKESCNWIMSSNPIT